MKYYSLFFIFVICFFAFLVQGALASNDCESEQLTDPIIDVTFDYGKVIYNNKKSNKEFPAMPYDQTRGLTVTNLSQNLMADGWVKRRADGKYCMGLKRVSGTIGFGRIDVFIDKRYRPGSCNYNVIKEHEKYHVRVQQEGLKAFTPKIKKALQIAANKQKPRLVNSSQQLQQQADQMLTSVQKEIAPLMNYVQKQLKQKNAVIDTDDSYKTETKRCKSW